MGRISVDVSRYRSVPCRRIGSLIVRPLASFASTIVSSSARKFLATSVGLTPLRPARMRSADLLMTARRLSELVYAVNS